MGGEAQRVEEIPELIPLQERNDFQIFLMSKMMGENPTNSEMIDWSGQYAEKVSNIIDDMNNEHIRHSIMNNDYDDAAQEILKLLTK